MDAVARHTGAELIRGRLVEVDGGHAVTDAGDRLPYDALLRTGIGFLVLTVRILAPSTAGAKTARTASAIPTTS
jgi:hypothetical protein